MAGQNSKDLVQKVLDLIDQQTKLLQRKTPMTEEEARAYGERFSQIKMLVEQLSGETKLRESVL